MNKKYWDGVDMLGAKEWIAGVGEIKEMIGFAEVGVDSDSISQDDIKPAF